MFANIPVPAHAPRRRILSTGRLGPIVKGMRQIRKCGNAGRIAPAGGSRYDAGMAERSSIHVLSDHVINKIAAGEVVDRPASVVKELLENALDAGATRLEIEVLAGGRSMIRVVDNGHGMSRDDALLSVERHATSKIRDVDDIEHIGTLGFRGEALAAISAVSRFTLQTAETDSPEGTEIEITGGRISEVKSGGFPQGTCITVRNLFFNVPARRKFLRTDQTELSQVRQVVMLHVIAHPSVAFKYIAEGRCVLDVPQGDTLFSRLARLHPRPVCDSLLPVDFERDGVRVTGFAGVPMLSRTDRAEQYIFINGRPAGAPLLQYALNEGYQTLLPRGRHPLIFLFIQTPAEDVDVNVHPTKKEVRFRRPGAVRDAVIEALHQALNVLKTATPDSVPPFPAPTEIPAPPPPKLLIPDLPEIAPFAHARLPSAPPFSLAPGSGLSHSAESGGAAAPEPAVAPETRSGPWTWCRVVGQIGGLFVVLETDDGLVLMDPHAAHERVLFERFMDLSLKHAVKSQGLLVPETFDLPPNDAEWVRRALEPLKEMGFGIAEFGDQTFMVDAVPAVLGLVSAAGLLPEIARTLEEGGPRGGAERWMQERIATAACRAAVKARDRLSLQEIERIVVDLAGSRMPYTCPHGRPTLIHFSIRDLYRKFGRLG